VSVARVGLLVRDDDLLLVGIEEFDEGGGHDDLTGAAREGDGVGLAAGDDVDGVAVVEAQHAVSTQEPDHTQRTDSDEEGGGHAEPRGHRLVETDDTSAPLEPETDGRDVGQVGERDHERGRYRRGDDHHQGDRHVASGDPWR
jgi:hypothetical protein